MALHLAYYRSGSPCTQVFQSLTASGLPWVTSSTAELRNNCVYAIDLFIQMQGAKLDLFQPLLQHLLLQFF